jgi:NADPH2:quinone reductase
VSTRQVFPSPTVTAKALQLIPQQGAFTLHPTEIALRAPRPQEIVIRTSFAGFNRADWFQLQGKYPLPTEHQNVPGLEISGTVAMAGSNSGFQEGDKVCALLSGGGFAEYALAPAVHCLPVPHHLTLEQAAALPEALATGWMAMVTEGQAKAGESILFHGGASSLGSMVIPLAKALGLKVHATAGTQEKCDFCLQRGADEVFLHRDADFFEQITRRKPAQGYPLIIDTVGGDYMAYHLQWLAEGGRLIQLAFLAGAKRELNLGPLLTRGLSWKGLTLRSRSDAYKASLLQEIYDTFWPLLETGQISPALDKIFTFDGVMHAFHRMQHNLNIGKMLLKV